MAGRLSGRAVRRHSCGARATADGHHPVKAVLGQARSQQPLFSVVPRTDAPSVTWGGGSGRADPEWLRLHRPGTSQPRHQTSAAAERGLSSPSVFCPHLVPSFVMVEASQWPCLCLGWGRGSFPAWKEGELGTPVSVAAQRPGAGVGTGCPGGAQSPRTCLGQVGAAGGGRWCSCAEGRGPGAVGLLDGPRLIPRRGSAGWRTGTVRAHSPSPASSPSSPFIGKSGVSVPCLGEACGVPWVRAWGWNSGP